MSAVMADDAAPGYRYHLLRGALERFSRNLSELDAQQLAAARARADRTWALESRVLASAEAADIVIPPAQVDAAFAEVAARYPDARTLQADLAANGLDESRLRQALHRELVFDGVMQRVGARRASVSQLDARLYYELHADRFVQPEKRTVRQILITINDDFAENSRVAAGARIGRIAARLAVSPNRFADQARRYSECPSALEGGRLGSVGRGQLYVELDNALFRMREGQISDVLETEAGFHLLLCEKIHPPRTLAFSRVEADIRRLLDRRNQRNCQKAWLKSLGAGDAQEDAS